MKTIFFCTTNEGKKKKLEKDINDVMKGINIEVVNFEVNEIQDFDNEIVSKYKVIEVYEKIKEPCLALDSGLYINDLKNFPGSYIKSTLQTIGIEGILKLLDGKEDRECYINNSLAYYDGKDLKIFSEKLKGTISTKIYDKINNDFAWSDLYKIYIPEGYNVTLAEMNNEEYIKRDNIRKINGITTQFAEWFKNK